MASRAGWEGLEYLTERFAGNPQNGPRPACVEVEIEISTEEERTPRMSRPRFPRPPGEAPGAVELSCTSVSEIMIPSSAIVSLPSTVTARAAAEKVSRTAAAASPSSAQPRRHHRNPARQGPLGAHGRERDPDSVVPARVVRPPFSCPRRATPFNSSMSCGETAPRWPSCWTIWRGGRPGHPGRLARATGRPHRRRARHTDTRRPDQGPGRFAFRGRRHLPLELLNDRFDLRLPTEEDFQTVGGLAFQALGRLPEPGATFRYDGVEFTILEVHDHAIGRVMIDLQPVTSNANGF